MWRSLGVSFFLLAAGCSSSSSQPASTSGGQQAFIGTWTAGGTDIVNCTAAQTVTEQLTGSLVITAGPTSNTIDVTFPDGCQLTFTVAGDVATVAPRTMVCNGSLDGGEITTSEESISHQLTLSSDGKTLSETGDISVTETLPPTDASDDANVIISCDWMTNGLYTKD